VAAQIYGKSIYVITEVALTPLSSKKEAEAAIARTQSGLKRGVVDGHDLDDAYDEECDLSAAASDDIEDEDIRLPEASDVLFEGATKDADRKSTSSVAEDVIAKKGGYGRFAQKWFSRAGWTAGQRRNLGLSSADIGTVASVPAESVVPNDQQKLDASSDQATTIEPETVKPSNERDVAITLLPKLLRTTQILFGSSRSFFFSYDYDITRSAANRRPLSESDTPLHKQVDPLYFWNRHVIQPFINTGQHSLVLPVMQGFVSQRTFVVDKHPIVNLDNCLKYGPSSAIEMKELSSDDEYERSSRSGAATAIDVDKPSKLPQSFEGSEYTINTATRRSTSVESTRSYLLTLISRRSAKRSGLRYLRRGVDDEGNTANTVETEQILSNPDWSQSSKVYSFLQVRGSIPLFFSQSPYSFKPVPQMQQSAETNLQALKTHFINLSSRYGSVQVVSLVEKHNTEAQVGEEFEKNMARLNESGGVNGNKVGFEWFDFHAVCRGMKFENVSLLLDSLGPTLDSFGNSIEIAGELTNRQSGILRTNCMDCLDRTNVVQSACGRRALEVQLKDQSIDLSAQVDQVQQWFNTLWADNGDAISKQYASTAAMKGDFTRTRKRDYKGALTDMGISIARFYSG
jgi:SacI homology domain